MQAILILHDIRSAHNVGSLFRTADAVGISKIYMSAITPAPLDRFGRHRSDIAKTALGAEKTIGWEQYDTLSTLITSLKNEGYTIVAIEQSVQSIDYKSIPRYEKVACILGNEVGGIDQTILALVDAIVEIPMKGKKESLNVTVAGGIVLFRMLDR